MDFDSHAFKTQFPLFSNAENTSLVYLDNAATTQKPKAVIDAISDFYLNSNANAHRGSHRLGRAATAIVEAARASTAAFVGAQADEIIFTRGATEAFNLLAFALTEELQPGDEIILSEAEHHANLVPWQLAAQRKQAVLRFLPVVNDPAQGWRLGVESLPTLLSPKTKIISLTAASNVLGTVTDFRAVQQALAEIDIEKRPLFIVDAAQFSAHAKLDVNALGCDFLVLAGHKLFGPLGVGVLFGRQQRLAQMPPWQGGGEMITQVGLQKSDYALPPYRFEPGTSSLADLAGWRACMNFWQALPRAAMAAYEQELLAYTFQRLAQVGGLRIINAQSNNVGIVSLAAADPTALSLGDLADWLDQHDIAVRVGHHCAQPLLQRLGVTELLRISLAAYNSCDDIDQLVTQLVRGVAVLSMQKESRQKQTVMENIDNPNQIADCSDATDDTIFNNSDDITGLAISQLLACKNWQARYKKLLQWGDRIAVKPALRNEKYRVQACESGAWLASRFHHGNLQLVLDSNSRLVKGLSVVLMVLLVGKSVEEFQRLDIASVFQQLQLEKYLSASRSNGFWALLKAIYAQVG